MQTTACYKENQNKRPPRRLKDTKERQYHSTQVNGRSHQTTQPAVGKPSSRLSPVFDFGKEGSHFIPVNNYNVSCETLTFGIRQHTIECFTGNNWRFLLKIDKLWIKSANFCEFNHLPIQNLVKMLFKISTLVVFPIISEMESIAALISNEINSLPPPCSI